MQRASRPTQLFMEQGIRNSFGLNERPDDLRPIAVGQKPDGAQEFDAFLDFNQDIQDKGMIIAEYRTGTGPRGDSARSNPFSLRTERQKEECQEGRFSGSQIGAQKHPAFPAGWR